MEKFEYKIDYFYFDEDDSTNFDDQEEKYLNEKDEKMKKYYYCHCTWVREALKTGKVEISPTFCACSAGFYKQQWDVILDQTVRVDVLETILDGDPVCKFAVHLPKEVVEKAEKK